MHYSDSGLSGIKGYIQAVEDIGPIGQNFNIIGSYCKRFCPAQGSSPGIKKPILYYRSSRREST